VRQSGLWVVLLGAATGCNPFATSGNLTAHWKVPGDSTPAAITMPVTARWCVGPSRLDIRAVAGDTGLGVAIYPSDSSALGGDYIVLAPDSQLQIRPSARVALRWVGKVLVQGWWGDSGSVTLAGSPIRGLSGHGAVWLISGITPDSVLSLEFEFTGVRTRNDTLCDVPVLPVAVPIDTTGPPSAPGVD
jgi:hypothetical protein